MTKKVTGQDYLALVVAGLIGLLIINFGGDWAFRGSQIEINEIIGDGLTLQAEWNISQSNINILISEVLTQLDKDVRSNMKVIDQLTGLLLRGDF